MNFLTLSQTGQKQLALKYKAKQEVSVTDLDSSVPELVGIPCHMFYPVFANKNVMISAFPSPITLMNVFTVPTELFVLVRALSPEA